MDGLVSVLRFLLGTVVPATQLPTRVAIVRDDPFRNDGSNGTFSRYGGFSTRRFGRAAGEWVYFVTVTDSSATGGIRNVTCAVFFDFTQTRFTQSENIPFE